MSRGAHFNRGNRRSGGDQCLKIVVGESTKQQPMLSVQCFEGRHSQCFGYDNLFGGAPCECGCHSPQPHDWKCTVNADEWQPTSFLAYHAGVLQQKWIRRCYEYRDYGGVSRRCEWWEHEWRDVQSRATEPQTGQP